MKTEYGETSFLLPHLGAIIVPSCGKRTPEAYSFSIEQAGEKEKGGIKMLVAKGNNYILTYERLGIKDLHESFMPGHFIINPPEVGKVYDFTEATKPVWVCGEVYNTVRCGISHPINVMGKKIKVVYIYKGDESNFAEITFKPL